MSPRKVLLICASPADSLGSALASRYAAAASASGHTVRRLDLHRLAFDPVLHQGYQQPQALEPDLQAAQADILWAGHLVVVTPVWWGSVPALLKGFLDRVLLPGFAFRYAGQGRPERLLGGRSARLLLTMDSPPWYFRWVQRAPAFHQLARATLGFCGVHPVRVTCCGPVIGSQTAQRERWLQQASALGAALR